MSYELKDYLEEVSHYLLLDHWELILEIRHDPSDVAAEVVKVKDRPCAVIYFTHSFLRDSPENIRHYLVHELLHLHVHRLWRHIESLQPLLGALVYAPLGESAHSDMEEMIDQLAYVIEPLVPLPKDLLSQAILLHGKEHGAHG